MYKMIIKFIDGETYISDLQNNRWNDMPKKIILQIEYVIMGKTFTLRDFEAYNHLIEKFRFIQNNEDVSISKLFLMGKYNNEVYILEFNVKNSQFYTEFKLFGQEYNNKPVKGWKPGISSRKPTVYIETFNSRPED